MSTAAPVPKRRRTTAIWLAANVVGASVFLFVASSYSWVEPELAQYPGASGGMPIVWALSALPVFGAFLLLNVGAFLWACVARMKRGLWPFAWASWASVPIWLVALVVDNLHHGA
jgi:hypothetical protein